MGGSHERNSREMVEDPQPGRPAGRLAPRGVVPRELTPPAPSVRDVWSLTHRVSSLTGAGGHPRWSTHQFNPISAESPEPAPERQDAPKLRSLPAVQPDYSSMDAEERPTLSLGGSTVKNLKVLSLGARMRGRSLVDDTDLTPDEIAEVLETAAQAQADAQTRRAPFLSGGQNARHDLPASQHAHPGLASKRAWRSSAVTRFISA